MLSFAGRALAESVKRQLDAETAFQTVIEDFDIPSRQTRAARQKLTYYLPVRLDAERTRRRIGEGAFEKLLLVEPGRCSGILQGVGGFYVIVVDSYHPPEALAESQAQTIARRELRRVRAAHLVRSILRDE